MKYYLHPAYSFDKSCEIDSQLGKNKAKTVLHCMCANISKCRWWKRGRPPQAFYAYVCVCVYLCMCVCMCGGMLMSQWVEVSMTLNSAVGRICICRSRSRSSRDRNSIDRGHLQWSDCTSNLRLLEWTIHHCACRRLQIITVAASWVF